MSHHQTWDALILKGREREGGKLGVETKKNKRVAFLIKAALKERVGVLGSSGVGGGGGRGQS